MKKPTKRKGTSASKTEAGAIAGILVDTIAPDDWRIVDEFLKREVPRGLHPSTLETSCTAVLTRIAVNRAWDLSRRVPAGVVSLMKACFQYRGEREDHVHHAAVQILVSLAARGLLPRALAPHDEN